MAAKTEGCGNPLASTKSPSKDLGNSLATGGLGPAVDLPARKCGLAWSQQGYIGARIVLFWPERCGPSRQAESSRIAEPCWSRRLQLRVRSFYPDL